jgi:hypothetical protein
MQNLDLKQKKIIKGGLFRRASRREMGTGKGDRG